MTETFNNFGQVDYSGPATLTTFGVPCPRAAITSASSLSLFCNGDGVESVLNPVAYWSDGSIKWLHCKAILPGSGALSLAESEVSESVATNQLGGVNLHRSVSIDSSMVIEIKGLAKLRIEVLFHGELQNSVQRLVSSSTVENALSTTTKLHIEATADECILNFYVSLERCSVTGEIFIRFRVHNPKAADHPGGCWDLGDPGSAVVKKLSLTLHPDDNFSPVLQVCDLNSRALADFQQFIPDSSELILSQTGSGGEHWDSDIHWDREKKSTVTRNGFTVTKGDNLLIEGGRAVPRVTLVGQNQVYNLELQYFWQNFPSRINVNGNAVVFELFPVLTELQGGESKTWSVSCFPGSEVVSTQSTKPVIRYQQEYLNQCDVVPHIKFTSADSYLKELIFAGLEGADSFFEKREKVDEYGWRNFGELYADHECHEIEHQGYFISHYNNQYDPLMGMILQYLHHAGQPWLELIFPLNQHIQDIDIYDTENDKPEYNGGLFWHTNHYLPAETCTHRSYSKHHKAVYEDYQGGGGPGGQHCYTTGLALQYLLFADELAKDKVLQLTNWVRTFYNGNGSLLDRTFRFLTIDFKKNAPTNIGIKAPGYKYPLDRGTGNYLIALLDCFEVTGDQSLLIEMAHIVRNTCHPNEDITLRDLDNVEATWFYTVFFQAVGRYLFLKESRDEPDDDYWYARQCLTHFCSWLFENEVLYLDRPEKLEFPNETWSGQDLRKAKLLCYAYYFAQDPDESYIDKAQDIYKSVVGRLQQSEEAVYTRLLALMMHNDGVFQKFSDKPRSTYSFEDIDFGAPPSFSSSRVVANYVRDMVVGLFRFSYEKERVWLRSRVG